MTIGGQFKIEGIAEIERELKRIETRGGDLARAHQNIGAVLESRVNQRFDAKTDPTGAVWVPHKASTRARYDRGDTNKRGKLKRRGTLLRRTGLMLDSLSYAADAHSVSVGFGRPYALYIETGTRSMARRGMLMGDPLSGRLSNDDADAVLDLLMRHFET
ncbi:phage virion morphogenesis protein [Pandoraea fibrosis]|uniref:Phage virion morphogenesis protein n=1 Tax=Pandoraea fibrosis TaxID=1891094 RepID=A0A5E4XGF5_9BURK|nr:phage virion morphogenesis protein [Pandoraea fibrosis]VVE35312.1 hypothetical protein PFI31113_03830 [Pandoraea fibrosis]